MDLARFGTVFDILINGHIFDQVKAHLTGKLRRSCIAFQAADELRNIFLVLSFGFGTGIHFIVLSFQRFLFRLILVEHIKCHIRLDPACDLIFIHALNELVKLCKERLGWSKATTYTVIKRLCERGVVKSEDAVVTALVSKEQAQTAAVDELMEKTFDGSLPAFVAAFTRRGLSAAEAEELRRLIDACAED